MFGVTLEHFGKILSKSYAFAVSLVKWDPAEPPFAPTHKQADVYQGNPREHCQVAMEEAEEDHQIEQERAAVDRQAAWDFRESRAMAEEVRLINLDRAVAVMQARHDEVASIILSSASSDANADGTVLADIVARGSSLESVNLPQYHSQSVVPAFSWLTMTRARWPSVWRPSLLLVAQSSGPCPLLGAGPAPPHPALQNPLFKTHPSKPTLSPHHPSLLFPAGCSGTQATLNAGSASPGTICL